LKKEEFHHEDMEEDVYGIIEEDSDNGKSLQNERLNFNPLHWKMLRILCIL